VAGSCSRPSARVGATAASECSRHVTTTPSAVGIACGMEPREA
jgi:hypothetical protein